MAETEVIKKTKKKLHANKIIAFEAYITRVNEDIKDVQQEIKDKTETERAKLKEFRSNLHAATWKKQKLLEDLEEVLADRGAQEVVITLEDFDVGQDGDLDIELVKGEMKAEKEDRKD